MMICAYDEDYVAGRTGCELAREVIRESGLKEPDMYPALHEADIMKFVAVIDEKMRDYYTDTNLKRLRTGMGLSQRELAQLSGVALRQIQLLEEKHRDINKAQALTLFKLGKVLYCNCEDLLEI